jgi:hypothetical protein
MFLFRSVKRIAILFCMCNNFDLSIFQLYWKVTASFSATKAFFFRSFFLAKINFILVSYKTLACNMCCSGNKSHFILHFNCAMGCFCKIFDPTVMMMMIIFMSMVWDYFSEQQLPTGLLFTPRWYMSMKDQARMKLTGENSWLVHHSSLAIVPPELSSSKQEKLAKGMMNLALRMILVYTCRKFLWYGVSSFTFPPKEVVVWTYFAVRNSSFPVGLNPRNFGQRSSTLTPRAQKRLEHTVDCIKLYPVVPAFQNQVFVTCRFL